MISFSKIVMIEKSIIFSDFIFLLFSGRYALVSLVFPVSCAKNRWVRPPPSPFPCTLKGRLGSSVFTSAVLKARETCRRLARHLRNGRPTAIATPSFSGHWTAGQYCNWLLFVSKLDRICPRKEKMPLPASTVSVALWGLLKHSQCPYSSEISSFYTFVYTNFI